MMPYTFRHFESSADLVRLIRLHAEIAAADGQSEDASEARLREQMALPGYDPAQDCWVVEAPSDPDRLIAFSSVWKAPAGERADISGAVHPDFRRKGIGRILIGRTLVRARALGAAQAAAYADARNQPGNAFLREHRFLPVAAYTLLRARKGTAFEAPTWPAGFTVRSFDNVLDLSVLAQAMTSSYDGLWGHEAVTEDHLKKWLRSWEPEGIFLAFDAGGDVAGMCRAEMSKRLTTERGEPTGYIDAPGVIPWRRRHELYLPLLLTAVRYLIPRQPAAIDMESWGDEDRTLEVYRQAGFALVRQSVTYRLNLR
jgi:mycothiol synthase